MPQFSVPPNDAVPFQVVHADADLLVVNKPAGIVTQPGKGHAKDSLLSGLFARWGTALQNLGAARDYGLLHRLDRDTSGLLIVGLRPAAYDQLRQDFAERRIKKKYLAIVAGAPPRQQGTVQEPIREVQGVKKLAKLHRQGQPATTAFRVLGKGRLQTPRSHLDYPVSLVEASPATGRLHQIRVHMAHLGCPVLGDADYGSPAKTAIVPRLCLHAAELSFVHPGTKRRLTMQAPLPADMADILRRAGIT